MVVASQVSILLKVFILLTYRAVVTLVKFCCKCFSHNYGDYPQCWRFLCLMQLTSAVTIHYCIRLFITSLLWGQIFSIFHVINNSSCLTVSDFFNCYFSNNIKVNKYLIKAIIAGVTSCYDYYFFIKLLLKKWAY